MHKEAAEAVLSSLGLSSDTKGWWTDPKIVARGKHNVSEMLKALHTGGTPIAVEVETPIVVEPLTGKMSIGSPESLATIFDLRGGPVGHTINSKMEEVQMGDSSSLNATEIAIGGLLASGRNGYGGSGNGGGGMWGGSGSYGGFDTGYAFSAPSANAVRIDRNGEVATERSSGTRLLMEAGNTAVRDQFGSAHQDDQINRICARLQDLDNRAADQRFQSELRTNDRLLALQAELNENARESAKCCCDLKLQMCEDKSETLAAIAAVEGRTIERSLNAATARITMLETINALRPAPAVV